MKEQLISFETAKLAKEKGFKIGSRKSYTEYKKSYNYDDDPNHPESYKKGDITLDYNFYMVNNEEELGDISNKLYDLYEAPTQSLLQKWLREVHSIDIFIIPDKCYSYDKVYDYSIFKDGSIIVESASYETYEEALEKGLQEALKLLSHV